MCRLWSEYSFIVNLLSLAMVQDMWVVILRGTKQAGQKLSSFETIRRLLEQHKTYDSNLKTFMLNG